MWKVVLWLNIVWNLYATEASHHEPYYENLYVGRDGVALMEQLSIPINGNDDGNETTYLINNNPKLMDQETIEALRRGRRQRWKGLSDNSRYKKIKHRSLNMNFRSQQDVQRDEQLLILQKAVKFDEERQCVHGKTKFVRCNHCVCMGGQLYVCTTRKCPREGKKAQRKRDYKHIAFQNRGSCVEGDQIRSFDSCNRCYCGGGQVICTNKKCLQGNTYGMDNRKCVPGKRVKSSDNCNTCTCNTRKIITCTAKTCGPEISKHIEDMACVPNSWFSLSGSFRCRECYCINGKVAFCYMNLCAEKSSNFPYLSHPSSLKDPYLPRPGSVTDRCQMNDYIQDKCTRCDCGANGVWTCHSKIMYPHYSNKTCNAVPELLETYNLGKKLHRRYSLFSTRSPILSKLATLPFYNWFKSTPKPKRTTKSTMTTKRDYDRTTGLEPEDENYDRTTGLEPEDENYDRTTGLDPEDENYDRTTGLEPEDENYDRTTGLEPEDEILPEYTKGPVSSGGGRGKFPPGKPGKGGKKTTRPDSVNKDASESGIDTNVDRGPHCVPGQFFTQGSNSTCHGCFCTPTNEWKCWSIKDACRGFGPCSPGKMRKNSVAPCSVCYCGADKQNYCATDELCSYSIKPSKCEAVACLNYCAKTKASFGVCHVDKCVCVH